MTPGGWYTKGSSSYYFDHSPNTGMDMAQAEQNCQALNARLVTIEEIEELTAIRVYLQHLAMVGVVSMQDRYVVGKRQFWNDISLTL